MEAKGWCWSLRGSFFLFKAVLPGTDVLAGSTELGMVGMTRGIAREHGKCNITANCIGAAGIESEEAEG